MADDHLKPPLVRDFLAHLTGIRDQSPHTVEAYGRDLDAFVEYLDRRHDGRTWRFDAVDRLTLRGFLADMEQRGLARRSAARTLSAIRSFYRWLHVHHDIDIPALPQRCPAWRSACRPGC